jgi:hypothetical protein
MKTRKGGGFTLKGAEVNTSLIHEIIGLFKSPILLGAGTSGVVFLTKDALPGMCNPTTGCDAKFIVKIIPIGEEDDDDMFNKECAMQRDIYIKLLRTFNYSFVPMVIYSKIYTKEEFSETFPQCVHDAGLINQIDEVESTSGEVTKFGVIIMESFGDVRTLITPDDSEYYSIALREMSMLAQVGYKDDSRDVTNFLIQKSGYHHVYMIDFGTAKKIAPVDADIAVLSILYKDDKYVTEGKFKDEPDEIFIKAKNVINLTDVLAPIEAVIGPSRMTDEMKDSSIKLLEDLASLSLSGGKKSKRKRTKKNTKRKSKRRLIKPVLHYNII